MGSKKGDWRKEGIGGLKNEGGQGVGNGGRVRVIWLGRDGDENGIRGEAFLRLERVIGEMEVVMVGV